MNILRKLAEWIYPDWEDSSYIKGKTEGYQLGYNAHKKEIADSIKHQMGGTTIHKWENLDSNDGIYKRDGRGRIESLESIKLTVEQAEAMSIAELMQTGPIEIVKPKRKSTKKTTKKATNGKKKNNL